MQIITLGIITIRIYLAEKQKLYLRKCSIGSQINLDIIDAVPIRQIDLNTARKR